MSLQPRTDDGSFRRVVDDQAISEFVHRRGRVATYEIADRFELPRTTIWTALGRLEARDQVQRANGRRGRSTMWEPGPPYSLCGPQFADLRPDGVTLSDVADHLDEEVDGDSPSTATISRFENGHAEVNDPAVRRALYQLFTEEASQ